MDKPILIIDLWQPWTTCTICDDDTPHKWSIPVFGGFVVDNDWPYEWGGVPACERCYDEHSRGKHVEMTAADLTCMA